MSAAPSLFDAVHTDGTPATLTMYDIRELAEQALKEHRRFDDGPTLWEEGWRFQWDTAVSRGGCCHYRKHLITLSKPIFAKPENRDNALNVILHEVAHALAGHAAGHGPAWVSIARRIGCDARRCHSMDVDYKYTGTCACGANHHRQWYDKRRPYHCRRCHGPVTWNENR